MSHRRYYIEKEKKKNNNKKNTFVQIVYSAYMAFLINRDTDITTNCVCQLGSWVGRDFVFSGLRKQGLNT